MLCLIHEPYRYTLGGYLGLDDAYEKRRAGIVASGQSGHYPVDARHVESTWYHTQVNYDRTDVLVMVDDRLPFIFLRPSSIGAARIYRLAFAGRNGDLAWDNGRLPLQANAQGGFEVRQPVPGAQQPGCVFR